METRRYPIGTQTFSTIIEENCVYVDKTDLVYKMTKEYRYVFLARPRRFGKSLLCSTLKEYFLGNKDLFKGLKIDALEKELVKYPVIHLDFSDCKTTDLKAIKLFKIQPTCGKDYRPCAVFVSGGLFDDKGL